MRLPLGLGKQGGAEAISLKPRGPHTHTHSHTEVSASRVACVVVFSMRFPLIGAGKIGHMLGAFFGRLYAKLSHVRILTVSRKESVGL